MCHRVHGLDSEQQSSNHSMGALDEGSKGSSIAPSVMPTADGETRRAPLPSGRGGGKVFDKESASKGSYSRQEGDPEQCQEYNNETSSGLAQDSSPPRVDNEGDLGLALEGSSTNGDGPAVAMPDNELISMLMKKPKVVPCLRTKSAFAISFPAFPRHV